MLPETLQWCQEKLRTIGYQRQIKNPTQLETIETAHHYQAYTILRTIVADHIKHDLSPSLGTVPSPTGAYDWQAEEEITSNYHSETLEDANDSGLLSYDNYALLQPSVDNDAAL